MPTVQEVIKDPDFLGLPDVEKRKVLTSIDTDFAGLPDIEQNKVVMQFKTGGIAQTPEIYEATPKWKGQLAEGIHDVVTYGGMGVGGALGATGGAAAGGIGAIPGGIAGGALGYAAGAKIAQEIIRLTGLTSIKGERPQPTFKGEMKKTFLEDIPTGAALEMGGRVIPPIAGGLIKPLTPLLQKAPKIKDIVIENPAEKILSQLYKKYKIQPLPSEILPQESKTLSIMESVLGYSPWSGDVILRQSVSKLNTLNTVMNEIKLKGGSKAELEAVGNAIKNEAKTILGKYSNLKGEQLNQMSNMIKDRLATTRGNYDTGKAFVELLQGDLKNKQEAVRTLYDDVDKLMTPFQGEKIYFSKETQAKTEKLFYDELAKVSPNKGLLERIRPYIPENALKGLKKEEMEILLADPKLKEMYLQQASPQGYTWTGLKGTRSDLLEMNRTIVAREGLPTNESRIYKEIAESIDKDMGNYAHSKGGNIWATYGKAKTASRTMHELYDDDVLGIMNLSPEDVVRRIINNNEVTLLKKVKNIFGMEGVEPLRKGLIKQLVDNSIVNGRFNGAKLRVGMEKIPKEAIDDLLPAEQRQFINKMANEAEFINAKYFGKEKMQTLRFLETLSGTSNEKVVNAIFKPDNTRLIKLSRRLLSQERMKEIEQLAIEKVFKTTSAFSRTKNELIENLLPVSSTKEFFKYQETMKELLPPNTYNDIVDFLKVGINMKKVEQLALNASQTGQTLMGWALLKTALQSPMYAAEFTGLPYIMSKIYTSPTALTYFKTAIKLPSTSKQAIESFSKAFAIATGQKYTGEPKEKIYTYNPDSKDLMEAIE